MDIISLPLGLREEGIERYRLVIIASQRARQLVDGAKPYIETKNIKVTSIAFEEVLQGKIEFLTGKEARIAQKEYKETKRTKAKGFLAKEENQAEIKKDLNIYLDDSNLPAGRQGEKVGEQEETR